MKFTPFKREFIENYTISESNEKAFTDMFNRLAPFEIKWGKDICNMPSDDIENVFGEITGTRVTSRNSIKSLLLCYLNWCIKHGYRDESLGVPSLDSTNLGLIQRRMVSSPEHLQRLMDVIFDPEDKCTYDNICRCYFWLAFMGFKEQDALQVSIDDVDLDNVCVVYSDRRYIIPTDGCDAMQKCKTLNWFVDSAFGRKASRDDSKQLLRGKSNTNHNSINSMLKTKFRNAKKRAEANGSNFDIEISYSRILLSGEFYRVYINECAGNILDFTKLAIESGTGRTRQSMTAAKQKASGKYYKQDYEQWKLAFADYLNK